MATEKTQHVKVDDFEIDIDPRVVKSWRAFRLIAEIQDDPDNAAATFSFIELILGKEGIKALSDYVTDLKGYDDAETMAEIGAKIIEQLDIKN